MNLLPAASGMAEGLDVHLQRLLEQAKLEQLSKTQDANVAEQGRHNLAEEDLQGRDHQLRSMDAQARIRESAQAHDDAALRARRDDGRALADAIPGNTFVGQDDPAVRQMQEGGMGSLLKTQQAHPAISVGPIQPGDSSEARPDGFIKLRSSKQVATDAADADKRATLDEKVRHDKGMENKPPAPDRVLIQTPDGYMRRSDATQTLAGGGTVAGSESAQTKNRRDLATAVGSHYDDVVNLIDEADKKGLLGPIKGRTFAEFMANKVGSTGNADNDELLGELRTQIGMYRTGVASLHGRTGANQGIAKDLEKKMDEGFMDPALLKGGLKGLQSWVTKYASKPTAGGVAAASDPYQEYLNRTKK